MTKTLKQYIENIHRFKRLHWPKFGRHLPQPFSWDSSDRPRPGTTCGQGARLLRLSPLAGSWPLRIFQQSDPSPVAWLREIIEGPLKLEGGRSSRRSACAYVILYSKGNFADVSKLEIFKQGGYSGLSHVITGVFTRGSEAETRDVTTALGGRVTCSEDGRRGREPKDAGHPEKLEKARHRLRPESLQKEPALRKPCFQHSGTGFGLLISRTVRE